MGSPTKRVRRGAAALALGALASVAAPAPGAGAASGSGAFPVAVAYNFGFAGVPDELSPDTYDFRFVNVGDQNHEMIFFKMAEDREDDSRRKVIRALDNEDFSLIDGRPVGFAFAKPRRQTPAEVNLQEEGRYMYVCFFTDNGVPHYKLDPGMLGFIDVE